MKNENVKPKTNRGKGRPQRRKPNTRPEREERIEGESQVSNNPNWYYLDEKIADLSTHFSFNQYVGETFSVGPENNDEDWLINTPYLAKIYVNPSAGYTSETNPQRSGFNAAMLRIFTQLSSGNAKTTNYAPQDIGTLMLALGSVLSYVNYIKRFYGIATLYNQRNRYIPKQLLEDLGVSADSFLSTLADSRLRFNAILTQINKIPFPVNVAYFEKCSQMYANLYSDAEVAMSQIYAMVPYSHWEFKEDYNDQGTGLITVVDGTSPRFISDILDSLQDMVDALLNSATLNYIYSDVLNMASKSNVPLISVSYLEEAYFVAPIYDKTFLMQIENATITGVPNATSDEIDEGYTPNNDVTPNANMNAINYRPVFTGASGCPNISFDVILNFDKDDLSVAERVDATRYSVIGSETLVDGQYRTAGATLPDHYVVWVAYYYNNLNQKAEFYFSHYAPASLSVLKSVLAASCTLDKFAQCPRMYWHDADDTKSILGSTGDFQNITTIDYEYLSRVNDLIYFGLFSLR